MNNLQINKLQDVPQFMDDVIRSLLKSNLELITRQDVEEYMTNSGSSFFVLHQEDRFIGMANNRLNDMPDLYDLNNWLADVYVIDSERNKGFMTLLISFLLKRTISTIYLYATNEGLMKMYNTKFGFSLLEKTMYHNRLVYVMKREINCNVS